EEAEMKHQSEIAQNSAGTKEVRAVKDNKTVRNTEQYNRNEIVTITNGTEEQTVKYKKAEPMLSTGEWKIVTK
ncbi:MAG: hypothetical protein KBC78_03680, partial [Candidatus Pacebacteria bacterium]|nr:hypothetical protein [Candidatus Paceibacterota bacterium]